MCYPTQSKKRNLHRLPKRRITCNVHLGPHSPEPPESAAQNSEDPEELLNVKFHRLNNNIYASSGNFIK